MNKFDSVYEKGYDINDIFIQYIYCYCIYSIFIKCTSSTGCFRFSQPEDQTPLEYGCRP